MPASFNSVGAVIAVIVLLLAIVLLVLGMAGTAFNPVFVLVLVAALAIARLT